MQPSGIGQRRSFLVLAEGELEGTDGYWAEDDEDGAEGFLDALEDVFCVYDDAEFAWYQRRFQGRQTRRSKGKGRRKGKEKVKGRGGRRFFRSRKGKGRGKGRRKGRSHMVSEEGNEEEWNEGDEWNDSYDGYWADDQNWNEGYWSYDDLYYFDKYGYFQRKTNYGRFLPTTVPASAPSAPNPEARPKKRQRARMDSNRDRPVPAPKGHGPPRDMESSGRGIISADEDDDSATDPGPSPSASASAPAPVGSTGLALEPDHEPRCMINMCNRPLPEADDNELIGFTSLTLGPALHGRQSDNECDVQPTLAKHAVNG